MRPGVEKLIQKGHRSLEAALRLFEDGDYDFAASRAYYAMFYLAEAALLNKNLSFSKHRGVISAFAQHFTQTGILPQDLHRALRFAFDKRNIGDYGIEQTLLRKDVEALLRDAKQFIEAVEGYLRREET